MLTKLRRTLGVRLLDRVFISGMLGPFVITCIAVTLTQSDPIFWDHIGLGSDTRTHAPAIDLAGMLRRVHRAPDATEILLLDVRSTAEFQNGHLPKARNAPGLEAAWTIATMEGVGKRLILYCGSSTCPLAAAIAQELLARGLTQVEVYKGGWTEWRSAHLPTES